MLLFEKERHYRNSNSESITNIIKILPLDHHPLLVVFVDLVQFAFNFIGSTNNLESILLFI